jgi:hypothetical protein
MNPGVFGAVFALAISNEPSIAPENGFEFVVALFAQLIPITQK